MKRLFLVYDDKDFAEWIEEELAEYGRIVRNLEGLDFFLPQWNSLGSADIIILPETVIKSQESFLNLYQTVKSDCPEAVFLFIFHREKDSFIEQLVFEGNICVSYDDLDTGLLEERLRAVHAQTTAPRSSVQDMNAYREPVPASNPEQKRSPHLGVELVAKQKSEDIEQPTSLESKHNSVSYSEDSEPTRTTVHYDPKSISGSDSIFSVLKSQNEVVEQKSPEAPSGSINQNFETETAAADLMLQTEDLAEPVNDPKQPKKKRSPEEQKAKLQRIKERIVIEEKIVTIHVPVHYNSSLVSIVSLYPRAGATFVTANFARLLGENKVPVAVLEPINPEYGSTHYELMYGEKNAPKEWISWAEQLQSNGYISQENNWTNGGVVWIPSSPEPIPDWSEEQTMQLLLTAKKYPVTLCDISSNYDEPHCKKILSMSDTIWIVTDGDPIQLSQHFKVIDRLQNDYPGKTIKIIGNKWSDYIKGSEWKEAVMLPVLTQIPDLGPAVLKHMWQGKMAWDDTRLKNVLSLPFKPMARAVMAKEMYQMLKKKYGFVAKVKGILSQIKHLDDEIKARKF